MRYIAFVVGLTLSAVAAFYSVTGLAYVFAGAFWSIIIMGTALEAAKLVGASWVFREWRRAPKALVSYVASGVIILMLITGIGIFGYLSRAYLIQQAPIAALTTERAAAERHVDIAKDQYTRDAELLQSLSTNGTTDKVITELTNISRLGGRNGAVSVLRTQHTLRADAQAQLQTSTKALQDAERTLQDIVQREQLQTVDIGPLMFVAKAYYGKTDKDTLDHVVSIFIGMLLIVFDPMAVALLLAAQYRQAITESRPTIVPVMTTATPLEASPEHHETPAPIISRPFRDDVTDSPDLYELRSGQSATYEPATIVNAGEPTEMPDNLNIDTESIGAPIIGTMPIERPTRRRARVAPKHS